MKERHASSFPSPLTPIIGREREVARASAMLRDRRVRLLTLTGPPGTGKTRLGLTLGRAVGESFPDGVWFVSLSPLTRPDLVLTTVAHVLEVRQLGRRPLAETLGGALRGRRILLVLDNFEHVLPAAPEIAGLLADCPELSVLVTSRAPLHISGEHRLEVPPLDVPGPAERADPRKLIKFTLIEEALMLFRREGESLGIVLCLLLLGLPVPPALRAEVGDTVLAMGWRASLGKDHPPADDLRAWCSVPETVDFSTRGRASDEPGPAGLTAREVEILKLLVTSYDAARRPVRPAFAQGDG